MFFNNEKLRGAGETVPMTEEEIKEYIKCKNNIFHFAKYFTIIGPAGEEKMKLRDYQEKIVKVICAKIPEKNNRIIMMGRQTGKTTIATLYILFNTYEDFSGLMSSLMNDETFLKQAGDKAGTYVAHLAGATDKVLASVKL